MDGTQRNGTVESPEEIRHRIIDRWSELRNDSQSASKHIEQFTDELKTLAFEGLDNAVSQVIDRCTESAVKLCEEIEDSSRTIAASVDKAVSATFDIFDIRKNIKERPEAFFVMSVVGGLILSRFLRDRRIQPKLRA